MASALDLVKLSTDAAERFTANYYDALSNSRHAIGSYYIQPTSDGSMPTILFNGNSVPNGAAVQEIFMNQMPPSKYEVQSFDCHVINPNYVAPDAPENPKSIKSHISILVLISGAVRYSENRGDPQRGFSETFVLVPNPQATNQKGGGKAVKDFLIQSQNFRVVV